MTFYVQHQESYSRGQVLLRTLLGFVYIQIPHLIALYGLLLGTSGITFIVFWAALFTGQYPRGLFDIVVGTARWQTRLSCSMLNLVDGYPAMGFQNAENVKLEIPYPETLSKGLVLMRGLFGIVYVYIPHVVVLMLRMIWTLILGFLAFWVVLFTGNYPEAWHRFNVGSLRWGIRVNNYMGYLTDDYPKFSGKE